MSTAAIDLRTRALPAPAVPERTHLATVIRFPVERVRPAAPPAAPARAGALLPAAAHVKVALAKAALFLVVLALVMGASWHLGLSLQPQVERTVAVVVQPGQTLWELAASAAQPGQDVRDVMAQIVQLNGLQTQAVLAGQELVVPQY